MPIFDQGYQHWAGTPSGNALRWLTIARHGVRVGMKNIFLRLLVIVSWCPAAILASLLCLWGLLEQDSSLITPLKPILAIFFMPEVLAQPKLYRVEIWTICYDYFLWFELLISMIVVLLIGPGLISLDLRFNALPLYFSRPLRRIDYFVGKLGVVAWFLGMVVVFPSLIAYVLGLLFSLDITIIWDTFPLLFACLGYGVLIVLSAGTLVLALSSLSRNSRYVALFWVALWFVGVSIGGILNLVDLISQERHNQQRYAEAFRAQQQVPPPGQKPLGPEEQRQQRRAADEAVHKLQQEIQEEEKQAAQTNWRWLVSYTANVSRVGDELLNYNGAWTKLSQAKQAPEREQFLLQHQGPQFPWYWSAGVLAVLFGLSVCTLNYRVRSLDRLK